MICRSRCVWPGCVFPFGLAWVALAVLVPRGWAAETYFRIAIANVEILQGKLPVVPATQTNEARNFTPAPFLRPYAVVDGGGEAFVDGPWPLAATPQVWNSWELLARSEAGQDLVGRLYLAPPQGTADAAIHFLVPAARANVDHRVAFLRTRVAHYDALAARGLPGSAWFRHQGLVSANELSIAAPNAPRPLALRGRGGAIGSDRALDLFTGQRAVSENLALDRAVEGAVAGRPTVAVDALRGITIAEIDWKQFPAERATLDPLAELIPADQHAVFLPSFAALAQLVDRYQQFDTGLWQGIFPPRQEYDVLRRYQDQLGVSLDAAARLLGRTLVRTIAITGGDLYLVTGTDVAIVFESDEPGLLRDALLANMRLALSPRAGVTARAGKSADVAYDGFASEDRAASGYVAALDRAVVLSNSVRQIERLVAVRQDRAKSLAALDELRYFRQRYPRGESGELAFAFLSDATIRRWCGPRWRIGAMRRARALAELTDAQASHVRELVIEKVQPREITLPATSIALETVRVEPRGIRSSLYNTLDFATPIAELPLDLVTSFEAEAYERWRLNYEQSWRWAFDPIGLQLRSNDGQLTADLTILPLIAGTEYRDLIDLTQGAGIPAGAGDRHGALAQVVLALRRESRWIGLLEGLAKGVLKSDVLSWLGKTASVYLDESPLWDELAQAMNEKTPTELDQWLRDNADRTPVAFRVDVTDRGKADEFLKSLRTFLEPMGYWKFETRQYREQPYTRLVATEMGEQVFSTPFALHVANLGDALMITIAEETLKKAIDRQQNRRSAAPGGVPAADDWAGRNLGLEVEGRATWMLGRLGMINQVSILQQQSWENLIVLNEWKRAFPDRDPLEVHQRLWGVRLRCPAGGRYVWNASLDSLESTAVGHPFRPRLPAAAAVRVFPFERAQFRLTFEQQGLRMEAQLKESRIPVTP